MQQLFENKFCNSRKERGGGLYVYVVAVCDLRVDLSLMPIASNAVSALQWYLSEVQNNLKELKSLLCNFAHFHCWIGRAVGCCYVITAEMQRNRRIAINVFFVEYCQYY